MHFIGKEVNLQLWVKQSYTGEACADHLDDAQEWNIKV